MSTQNTIKQTAGERGNGVISSSVPKIESFFVLQDYKISPS
ncbi:unnamed protein product [Larinioides sclopetarius]|uniref:Maturase K n=1 Tax=Larinioides sclopetarius TaxID=280406 RepID=A0AAV1Z5Y4_9ARAC